MNNFIELLICFIATLILHFAEIFLFGKLSNKKFDWNIKCFAIMLIFVILQVTLNIFGLQGIGTIFTVVYFYFMFQQIFHCTKTESQNYSVIIWAICLLIDSLVMLVVSNFGMQGFYEKSANLSKSAGTIIMSFLLVIIGKIKPFIIFINNKIYKKMCKLNISVKYIFLVIILFAYIAVTSSNNLYNRFLVTLLFIFGVLLIIVIIILLTMYYQIVTLKITNEILEKNNEVNQKAICQFRILKHNLESQLMGVKTVANKKARNLLDNLIKEYNESFYIKHDINSMPLGINGLVYEKLYKYNEDNIEISITNKIKSKILDTVGPRSYNLFCEALGVTLNNALESAKESKDKLVYIEFRENKEVIQMKIMNTFTGSIDLDKLGTVNYTSKSKGHGLGLYSLFGRKNLTITTSIKNNLFVNNIKVKKLKRK